MAAVEAPWRGSLRKALEHGGTKRKKRDRTEAKRKHVQVASVNKATGRPAVRTMVFRGFCSVSNEGTTITSINITGEGNASFPMLITDTRSGKYADFAQAQGSFCEICWWLDEAGVQFRLAGRVVVASAETENPLLLQARKDIWERLSDGTRRTFFCQGHPGKPKAGAELRGGGGGGGDAGPAKRDVTKDPTTAISPYFALCILVPDRVDELHLGGNQKRLIYSLGCPDGVRSACTRAETVNDILLQREGWSVEEVNP